MEEEKKRVYRLVENIPFYPSTYVTADDVNILDNFEVMVEDVKDSACRELVEEYSNIVVFDGDSDRGFAEFFDCDAIVPLDVYELVDTIHVLALVREPELTINVFTLRRIK